MSLQIFAQRLNALLNHLELTPAALKAAEAQAATIFQNVRSNGRSVTQQFEDVLYGVAVEQVVIRALREASVNTAVQVLDATDLSHDVRLMCGNAEFFIDVKTMRPDASSLTVSEWETNNAESSTMYFTFELDRRTLSVRPIGFAFNFELRGSKFNNTSYVMRNNFRGFNQLVTQLELL